MRELSRRKRRRLVKQQAKRNIVPTVEALEPRLALSATGFGYEAAGARSDLVGAHGHRGPDHAAIAGQMHDGGGGQRFALAGSLADRQAPNSDCFESTVPKPTAAGQARGGQLAEPLAAGHSEFGRRGPRGSNRPGAPFDFTPVPEGESPTSSDKVADFSSLLPVQNVFAPTSPGGSDAFTVPPPASLLTTGLEFSNSGQSATQREQRPQTSAVNSVSPPSSSQSTLQIVPSVSPPASRSVASTTPSIELTVVRFDSGPAKGDVPPHQLTTETAPIAADLATFVSLSQSDAARWWELDGESLEAGFASVNQAADFVPLTIATERTDDSFRDTSRVRLPELSQDSLWAAFSDGGFIDIDAGPADESRERFDSAEDSDNAPAFKRLSTETPRDAFWFDFGDHRSDLRLDLTSVDELASEQAGDDANEANEEAWLLDDGGMIVLTSSQFIDQAVEVAGADAGGSSVRSDAGPGESYIPMDAGIGVFQAIEVATNLVEQQADQRSDEGASAPVESDAAAGTADVVPDVEQAAKNSESDQSEPIQAASMPLLLALVAFLSGGHERWRKNADRRTKA